MVDVDYYFVIMTLGSLFFLWLRFQVPFMPFLYLSAPDSEMVVSACGAELQLQTRELLTEYKHRESAF